MSDDTVKAKRNPVSIKALFARYEVSVIFAVLLLMLVFTVFSENFFTTYNFFNISRTASLYMFIALGQAMVLIVGGMNLSLGQIGGLTVVIAGYLMDVMGVPIWTAVIAGVCVGLMCGLLNGMIISILNLNPFVVTLATSFVFSGLINGISKGFPYTKIPAGITWLGRRGIGFIPYMLILAVLVLIIIAYIFRYTVTGRRLLATGGNIEAAKMTAINTKKMIIIANMASGLFAAAAGLLWISRTGSAQPSTGGDWMVISFAVAVIGGTLLKGGVINPIGLFFAAYLIVMVKNGLVMLNVNIYFEQAYLGVILLLAVSVESVRVVFNKRRSGRLLKQAHKSAAEIEADQTNESE